MAKKKKAPPKSKRGDAKQAKSDDTTVELFIPQQLYNTVYLGIPDAKARDALIRALFSLDDESSKIMGMDTFKIRIKGMPVPKSDAASDDDGGEGKLCEEGP